MSQHSGIVSVVAPMFNEQETIVPFLTAVIEVLQGDDYAYEIILVDDGSKDNTFAIAKSYAMNNENIRIIRLSRNYGREIAMTAGLDYAIGDYIVLMDSDLQDPPELIPALLGKIREGYDIVYGARLHRDGEPWLKRITSTMFYRVANRLTGLDIPDDAGDFRVFTRQVVNSLTQLKEHNRYLKILYSYVGYNVGSVPFTRRARFAGKTKYNYMKLIEAALDAIISFSTRPLRIASVACVSVSVLAFLYAVYVLVQKLLLTSSVAAGWTSLMLLISVMFGFQFLFLSLLSEYVGRILIETKQRPLYYAKEEVGGTRFVVPSIVERT